MRTLICLFLFTLTMTQTAFADLCNCTKDEFGTYFTQQTDDNVIKFVCTRGQVGEKSFCERNGLNINFWAAVPASQTSFMKAQRLWRLSQDKKMAQSNQKPASK